MGSGSKVVEQEIKFAFTGCKHCPGRIASLKLSSKGFFDEVTIQDFPIRGQKVLVVFRNCDLIAEDTRITKEFFTRRW